MKTLGILIAVIVLAGAGYYVWSNQEASMAADDASRVAANSQAAQNNVSDTGGAENREAAMAGTWRSNTDAKFTREIRADGTMIDRYEGDTSAGVNGEWSIVDPTKESLGVPASSLTGTTVVKIEWEGGVEVTYFAINSLTNSALRITDLTGRGEVTTFTKVN